jgi:hypothetical protein
MARRTFDVIDIVEILVHWHGGRPIAVVAESLGTDRKTIRKYVAPAVTAGLAPGGPPLSRDQWTALVRGWFPELTDPRARSQTHAVIDAHRERIEEMLKSNKPTTVHQRLRDEYGLDVGISSFRLEFPDQAMENKVTVLRPDVAAGEEAQIDYGYLGRWFDPKLGRWKRVWGFVMVLAMSRHMFVRPTFRMDQSAWVAAHRDAFEFFGGYVGNRCQDASSSIRSSNPSKIFCLPIWPFFKASSRWRSSVGLNSMVVTKNEQDSQIDSKWQSISTGRAQYPLPSMRRSISLRSLAISFPSSAAGRAFGWS